MTDLIYGRCFLYSLLLWFQFKALSWKSLILKVCRGSYTPLPSHLPYELHYLIKHMLKTNPRDRPSVHTILSSHRVSKLLHKHLPEQVLHLHFTWLSTPGLKLQKSHVKPAAYF